MLITIHAWSLHIPISAAMKRRLVVVLDLTAHMYLVHFTSSSHSLLLSCRLVLIFVLPLHIM